jgi:hypothetical protein
VASCCWEARQWAFVVLLASVLVGCSSDDREPQAAQTAQPAQRIFEMPTYRFTLPTGWTGGIDEDPAAQEGAGFRSDEEYRVHGNISRNPVDAAFAASARERVAGIVEGHRGVSNILEIGEAEPLEFDIDGEEAWRTEARFGSDVDSFRMLWVAFQHDGQDYLVTFEGAEPLAESDLAAFEELLRSWEWL